jgi:hypothetical protein
VRLVEVSAQLGLLAAIVDGAAGRRAVTAQLCRFEVLRDIGDLFVQRCQQQPRLRLARVIDHLTDRLTNP